MLRENILEVVKNWNESLISEFEVHNFAEKLLEQTEILDDSESIDEIASEVLVQLDIMNHQLITKDDIPAIIEFLKTPKEKEIKGWEIWKNYWENIDFNKRKIELKNNPFYLI